MRSVQKAAYCWMGMVSMLGGQSLEIKEAWFQERGAAILQEVLSQKWAQDWKGAKLERVRLVEQKADLTHPTGLPPVWVADIVGADDQVGMMMWDSRGIGRLVEFTLDAKLNAPGGISGVPNLQQFPVKDGKGGKIASGCVPTAAASLLAYWAEKRFPQWRGDDGQKIEDLTLRLRRRLSMSPFPDTDGFTSDGMTLAGAFPHHLAAAIRNDALEKGVNIDCEISRFSIETLKKEIGLSRPVLLSCTVRVPHKPHLSWGHEVVGVAWATIDGVEIVGVVDNFYPTKHAETIRWIRADAFRSLIAIRPKKE
ncbi:hypothetical protein N9A94_02335 [Akkermansiaceae bacterium]|nr:hypothetical protein [Akkermansiaceae bacterium]MDB4544379.1 hypothetical protein [Akkermansiaceae bacterium]